MDRLDSTDPATGETIGSVEVSGASAVSQAVQTARDAQPAWASTSVRDRTFTLHRFRRLLAAERDDVARLVTRECGKPLAEARAADVFTTLDMAAHLERHAPAMLGTRKQRLRNPLLMDRVSEIRREPLGVIGVISPWNFPLAIPATGVLSALVAGNCVVLKPSEHTPLIGQRLVDLLHEAGVPEDVLQVVHGAGETGAALVDSDVDGMVFTGSVPTGQKIAQACASRFHPALLELGGKDPAIVLDGAHQATTIDGITWGAFTNAGQACASVERVYVPRTAHDDYTSAWAVNADSIRVGNGLEDGTEMGPLIDDASVRRVMDHIKQAEDAGAEIASGGEVMEELGPRFVAPTVLTGVDHSMTCMQEETFGPTMPVMAYDDVDDAVRLANDSRFGLTASVWGPAAVARPVADRLHAGTAMINDCVYTFGAAEVPWSGRKQSGIGHSHGPSALDAVTRITHTNTTPGGKRSPWRYPYDEAQRDLMDGGMEFLHGGRRRGVGRLARGFWRRRRQ